MTDKQKIEHILKHLGTTAKQLAISLGYKTSGCIYHILQM